VKHQRSMAKVSFIVARTDDDVIGVDNTLPWRLSTDLKNFRDLTTGKIVIMGRKTLDSIGHPLPNRENFVISRDRDLEYKGVKVFDDINTAVLVAEASRPNNSNDEIFVIGGEQIFLAMEKHVSRVHLTQIHTTGIQGDAHFRMQFPEDDWTLRKKRKVNRGPNDEYDFTYYLYERKKKKNKDRNIPNKASKHLVDEKLRHDDEEIPVTSHRLFAN
jgi:dihydrofolate reductase